jgi:hypothetical protein
MTSNIYRVGEWVVKLRVITYAHRRRKGGISFPKMKVGKKRANWSIDPHIVCKLAHDAGIIYPGRTDTSK